MAAQWKLVTVLALQTVLWICLADESTGRCSEPCMCCTHGLCNDANTCDGCKDGFTGPNCMEPCHANCKSCSQTFLESEECFDCKDGFYIGSQQDSDLKPWQTDCTVACKQNCKTCNSYFNCTECKAGHFFDANNDCKKCPDYCQICLTETVCLKCDESYFWDKSACSQCMTPCKSCRSSHECDICPEGHLLFKGNCLECLKPCKSCKVIAGSQQVCDDCAEGYYMQEQTCLKCSEHCTSCLNATNCKTCENKYKPHKGKCFLCETPCTSCSSDNICTSCQDKYFNLNWKCIMYPKSCFLCLADIMFKENSSSFIPANSSFVCPDKIDLCKDMYKVDNCGPHNADCLQDMCKLTAGECRNTSLREHTTNFSIQDVKSEDGDNPTIPTIVLSVACGILVLGFLAYIIIPKIIKKKEPNTDDIRRTVPDEEVALLRTEILGKDDEQLSSYIDSSDKEDLSSYSSENSRNVTEETVGIRLTDYGKTTDVDWENTVAAYKKSKAMAETLKPNLKRIKHPRPIKEITIEIDRFMKIINQLHEEKAAREILEQIFSRGSIDLQAVLSYLSKKGRKSKNRKRIHVSAEHRTRMPLAEARKEKRSSTGEFPRETTKDDVDGYVRKLTEKEFGDTRCRKILDSLRRNNITFENLAYFGNQLKKKVPQFPEEVPTVSLEILNKYGSGYTSFIPDEILKTCAIYKVSGKDNSCLFNAVSVALYGDENQASMLKLLTATLGAADIEIIVHELMCRYKTKEEVAIWAAKFISNTELMRSGTLREMLEKIVKDELMCTIDNNFSGPVHLEILASIIGRKIEVYRIGTPELCFGKHENMTLKLVHVPYHIEKLRNDVRFNHFVPAIETKKEENVCLADSVGLCQGQQDDWVKCRKCHRMLHFYCAFGDIQGDQEVDQGDHEVEDCGCTKIRPFARVRCGALFFEEEIVHGTLQELEIQRVLVSLCQDLMKPDDQAKLPSWRKREISTTQVLQADTLVEVDEKVIMKIKNFIENTLEENVEEIFMHGVLVPEVFVRLIMKEERCNRLEAECILKDCKKTRENTGNETSGT